MSSEFKDNSAAVKHEIELQAIRGLIQACMLVEGVAVGLAPVDTGALRDSIDYRVDRDELVGYVGTNCEYAVWIEFGTGEFAEKGNGRKGGWVYTAADGKTYFTYGQKPTKFLRKAFRQNKSQIQEILEDCLRNLT